MHPEHCFLVKLPQTSQESSVGGMARGEEAEVEEEEEEEESKLASTMKKYLDAVFLTRWSNPRAIRKAVTMN